MSSNQIVVISYHGSFLNHGLLKHRDVPAPSLYPHTQHGTCCFRVENKGTRELSRTILQGLPGGGQVSLSQTWKLVRAKAERGYCEGLKVDGINPFVGCCMLLMEWRGTSNVFGGVPNSQATLGVSLEHFVLHTQMSFPPRDHS